MISHSTNAQVYNVKFCPFNKALIAVVSNETFELTGTGSLHVLFLTQNGDLKKIGRWKWANGLFDICWLGLNNLFTASGDGYIQIWSIEEAKPKATFLGHSNEISSIDLDQYNHLLATASWDNTVKIWDITQMICLTSLKGHNDVVHEVKFSNQNPNIFASVSGDRTLKLWCISSSNPISIQVHDTDVLSCDWSEHINHIIATSGSDSLIRIWDLRKHRQPLFQIKAGNNAVKQVKFSPHFPDIIGSVSFDFSTKIWDVKYKEPLEAFYHHSEFVYGLDWNRYELGNMADCSWDGTVRIFNSSILKVKNKM